jgi:hypothetical protein
MGLALARVIQAAIAAALLETTINAYPFHSIYPVPVAMYAIFESLLYLAIICVAAFAATRIPRSSGSARKVIFFVFVIAPSLLSSYFLYRNASSYTVAGRVLIDDHRITSAGFEHLLTNIGIAALLALVAALVYFRNSPRPDEA